MSVSDSSTQRCEVCKDFVASLERIHEEGEREDQDLDLDFDWSFRDEVPALPRLATSARRGCPWCSFLDKMIARFWEREAVRGDESLVLLSFSPSIERRSPDQLQGVVNFRISQNLLVERDGYKAAEIYVIDHTGESWLCLSPRLDNLSCTTIRL
jgi:hypothetical protein